MTTDPNTTDGRLERIAVALEGLLAVYSGSAQFVTNIAVEVQEATDAATADEVATEEAATAEPEVEETAAEDGEAEEAPAEDEAVAEAEPEGDPIGDDTNAGDPIDGEAVEIPDKLSVDHVRNLARDVMAKDGKAAVFEVLADIGPDGFKAVGEITETHLVEAFTKMTLRLRG